MELRMAALFFGIIFLATGVAWHLSFLFVNGLLLGTFQINSLQNKIHIASGLIALAATYNARLSQLYLKIFGSIYAFISILGLIFQDQFLALEVNTADNVLHLIIGLTAFFLGFALKAPELE